MYNGSTRLLDQFIAHISVERGLARATVRAYESDLRRYLSWLAHTRGITDPDAIGKADIEEYVAQLDSDGDSARSKARRLASIHEFHRFALAQHAVSDDVSATVKAPKSAQMLPDVLTIDEVSRLLDAIPDPHGTDAARGRAGAGALPDAVLLRDRALLEFMYATGCRVSEAVGMNLDDIDIDDAHVARLTGKGSKQRLVPLCADTSPRGAARWRAAPRARRNAARYSSTNGDAGCLASRYGRSSNWRGSGPASIVRFTRTRSGTLSPRT